MQKPQSLCRQLSIEKIDTGQVAARPSEARDKTKPDRVIADTEDDRNCRGCSFGRQCGHVAYRGDHSHLSANQIGHQRRQAIVVALQPVVLDCHVLALDGAGFVESFTECGDIARVGIGRPVSDKPDYRHSRLLRARRERPSGCAAEKRNELAPRHSITSSARASSVGGTSMPSVLAVLRFRTSCYLVGACTGRSAGLSPLRMRST